MRMGPFDRNTFDPEILGGRAGIRGMRIPVSIIVGAVAHGASVEEILIDHPNLERSDVTQAFVAEATTPSISANEGLHRLPNGEIFTKAIAEGRVVLDPDDEAIQW